MNINVVFTTILCGSLILSGSVSAKDKKEYQLPTPADTVSGRTLEAPVNRLPQEQKFWWNDDWYLNGKLPVPANHDVIETEVSFTNEADGTEVPARLYQPKGDGKFPAILFQHGRRGLDTLVQRLPKRMAAQGFIVLAPDVFEARFIEPFPLEHKPETEGDVNAGIDFLLKQPRVSSTKACLYSHTRGGYYTLQVAVKYKRQNKDIACYASTYPHWQNPNATEPEQVYQYASEINELSIPTMIFIGEYEQYQRRRSIETAVKSMKDAGRDVKLIVYPGVGRGFDFRPPTVRTLADDMAAKDALQRKIGFFRQHLTESTTKKEAK